MEFIHKHTKAPWEVQVTAKKNKITYELNNNDYPVQEAFANAKLISIAPRLLQFSEMFHDHLEIHQKDSLILAILKKILYEGEILKK